MAKKKELDGGAQVSPTDVPDTGLLNPQAQGAPPPGAQASNVVIGEVDFQELYDLEKQRNATEEQLNKISGAIFRLEQDQKAYFDHERNLAASLELKRKELVKRYKIDDARRWQIDMQSRTVVYQS